jgi:hypothetical protein
MVIAFVRSDVLMIGLRSLVSERLITSAEYTSQLN